ncbi:MAG: MATE family efflux transporter, partial [Cellulosilyticum sp.]|nr:MATE family efflux transporter [Cellulosilyticum sp.]
MTEQMKTNPLGTQPVGKLLQQFAVPSIIAMIVSALYNIVDQFFIGRAVGELGNAATNIAFPLSISCIAIALLFGIGGASAFNLSMGKGKKDEAANYIGNAVVLLLGCGVILLLITQIFLTPMLKLFGSPDNVLEYASIYTRITSFGFPFLILATGSGNIIRADGSPKFSMTCNLVGAIINTILDAIFVFGFNMGMAGAAYATIIGQIVSGLMALNYLRHFKTVKLQKENFILKGKYVLKTISLGASPCINQLSMMLVQIIMNKSLTHYGALSAYGASVPLACAGIITKINQFYFSVVIGISQGLQPIVSYNYGARKYGRVKKACLLACAWSLGISVVAFIAFFFFPRQIISIFGNGSDAYFDFAVMYFRVFLFFTFLNFTQPIISNFFTSIGKPKIGVFLSLTRQILFLLPLVIILPTFLGIDGLLYAGPIADGLAGVICI